jgi:hypothetical protein
MTSRQRLVAILCLFAVILVASSPSGIGVATLPLPFSVVSVTPCCDPLLGPEAPQPRAGAARFLPSRAPPLA